MKILGYLTDKRLLALLIVAVFGFGMLLAEGTPRVQATTTWNTGDVFAGVSGGNYKVFNNAGVFKETITDGGGGFTTGCSFNNNKSRLYTTNFGNTKVHAFDRITPHSVLQTINTAIESPGGATESIVFDAAGNFYVGHPDGNDDIHKYNSAGVFQQKYNVAIDVRGSDWLDLATDQTTMFYTGEGRLIQRYDVGADAQLTDFATLPGPGIAFAFRLLSPFDGSGGLLVADGSNVKRLNGAGAVVQTYDTATENSWFSLNLDPNGTSFWAGDFGTSKFYRFNIASGAIEVGPISTGTGSSTFFGLCVLGEITAAVPQDTTPPECTIVGVSAGGELTVHVQDGDSGIKLIEVLSVVNATEVIPAFTPGTNALLVVTAQKDVAGDPSSLQLKITDEAGNVTECDPVLVELDRSPSSPRYSTYDGIPQVDRYFTISNTGESIITYALVNVNDRWFIMPTLLPYEIKTIDIGSAMVAGANNTVTVWGGGHGSQVMISDVMPTMTNTFAYPELY